MESNTNKNRKHKVFHAFLIYTMAFHNIMLLISIKKNALWILRVLYILIPKGKSWLYEFLKREINILPKKGNTAMEKVTTVRVYNLIDRNGNKLRLCMGLLDSNAPEICNPRDRGIRWSFKGTKIPVPIRYGTWFNGFPEDTMLDWLKRNGWYLETVVQMSTGRAKVHSVVFKIGNNTLMTKI